MEEEETFAAAYWRYVNDCRENRVLPMARADWEEDFRRRAEYWRWLSETTRAVDSECLTGGA